MGSCKVLPGKSVGFWRYEYCTVGPEAEVLCSSPMLRAVPYKVRRPRLSARMCAVPRGRKKRDPRRIFAPVKQPRLNFGIFLGCHEPSVS